MTTTLSPPIRIFAIAAVLVAAVLGIVLFMHNRSSSSGSAAALPSVSQSHATPATKPATSSPTTPTTTPAVKPVVKPKVVLLPGLPSPVAHALRSSKVVVVAVYARSGNGDMVALAQARAGAKSAHAGFAAVNALDDRLARTLNSFGGTSVSPPAVLVVKRPGKIVNQFDGFIESELVAQAALNAGAGR